MTRRRRDYPIGSVITGTLRTRDLILAFLTELDWHPPLPNEVRARMREIERLTDGNRTVSPRKCEHRGRAPETAHCIECCGCDECVESRKDDYYASDEANEDLEWLTDELGRLAGPFMYFGTHPGGGSDFGFWLSTGWECELEDDGGIRVNDLSEVPDDFTGYAAVVNDHGNVSLWSLWRDSRGRRHKRLQWEVV